MWRITKGSASVGGGYSCVHFGCYAVEMVVVGKEMIVQKVTALIEAGGVVFMV